MKDILRMKLQRPKRKSSSICVKLLMPRPVAWAFPSLVSKLNSVGGLVMSELLTLTKIQLDLPQSELFELLETIIASE